jgi:hypothetical protein
MGRIAQLVGAPRAAPTQRRPVVDGKIFNSRGVHIAIVRGPAIFNLKGKKLYDLKGVNIYKLSGELVGHLTDAQSTKRHLDKSTDKLFPQG